MLKAKLDQISKRPVPNDAVPLSDLAPVSKEEIRARSEAALRRHMKSSGYSDVQIDDYLASSKTPPEF